MKLALIVSLLVTSLALNAHTLQGVLFALQSMAIWFIFVLPLLCGCGNETKRSDDQDEISSEGQYEVKCNNTRKAPLVKDTPHNPGMGGGGAKTRCDIIRGNDESVEHLA